MAVLSVIDHMFFAMAIAISTYFQKIADPKDMASTAGVSFTISHIAAIVIPAALGLVWMWSTSLVFFIGAGFALLSLLACSVDSFRSGSRGKKPSCPQAATGPWPLLHRQLHRLGLKEGNAIGINVSTNAASQRVIFGLYEKLIYEKYARRRGSEVFRLRIPSSLINSALMLSMVTS